MVHNAPQENIFYFLILSSPISDSPQPMQATKISELASPIEAWKPKITILEQTLQGEQPSTHRWREVCQALRETA